MDSKSFTPRTPSSLAPLRPAPPTPLPWTWECHLCHNRYALAVTRRCLYDGHYYCSGQPTGRSMKARHRGKPCSSEFDYQRWGDMNAWRAEVRERKRIEEWQDKKKIETYGATVGNKPNCFEDCGFPSACRHIKEYNAMAERERMRKAREARFEAKYAQKRAEAAAARSTTESPTEENIFQTISSSTGQIPNGPAARSDFGRERRLLQRTTQIPLTKTKTSTMPASPNKRNGQLSDVVESTTTTTLTSPTKKTAQIGPVSIPLPTSLVPSTPDSFSTFVASLRSEEKRRKQHSGGKASTKSTTSTYSFLPSSSSSSSTPRTIPQSNPMFAKSTISLSLLSSPPPTLPPTDPLPILPPTAHHKAQSQNYTVTPPQRTSSLRRASSTSKPRCTPPPSPLPKTATITSALTAATHNYRISISSSKKAKSSKKTIDDMAENEDGFKAQAEGDQKAIFPLELDHHSDSKLETEIEIVDSDPENPSTNTNSKKNSKSGMDLAKSGIDMTARTRVSRKSGKEKGLFASWKAGVEVGVWG